MSQLAVFERAVREKPYQARIFGPPCWMVAEKLSPKADGVEVGRVTAELRAKYALDVPRGNLGAPPSVPTDDLSRQDVPTLNEGGSSPREEIARMGLCGTCHVNKRDGRNLQCSACRKALQRRKA